MNHTPASPRGPLGQRGNMMIYLVLALAALGLLGVAMTSFFSSSVMGTARPDCSLSARYLAEAGTRYAMNQLRAASEVSLAQFNTTLAALQSTTYDLAEGSFSLNIVDTSPTYTVTATGTSCADSDPATADSGSVLFTVNGPFCPGCGSGTDIAFENGDVDSFTAVGQGATGGGTSNGIVVNPEDGTISMGQNTSQLFGCIWYAGNKGTCTDGKCTFGNGFRSYWEFELEPKSTMDYADGFTFAMISAETNLITACGGSVGTSMGELLGYAGTGLSGQGIAPPKMAMEFDFYQNSGTGSTCNSGSRADPSVRDHAALVYWGRNVNSGGCDKSFDDNRHGVGLLTDSEPRNPGDWSESGDGYDGVMYSTSDFFRAYNHYSPIGTHKRFRIRLEVSRSTTPTDVGTYCYNVRGWIKKDNESVPLGLDDVSKDYYDPDDQDTAPDITDSYVLNQTWHDLFDRIYFGWTYGTGAANSNMVMGNFKLGFLNAKTCEATTLPTDYVSAWTMYEGTGATLHDINATSNNDGTITNATWVSGMGCPACSALLMSSSGGQARIASDNSLNVNDRGTVSAWIYLNDYVSWGGIVHKGQQQNFNDECYSLQFSDAMAGLYAPDYNVHTDFLGLVFNGDRRPMFCTQDSSGRRDCVMTSTQLARDTWYHVAATWNFPGNMTIYLNGVAQDTIAMTRNPQTTNSYLAIGAQFTTGGNRYPFDGVVDEVYLYPRALTAAEILALYQAGLRQP